MFNLLVSAITPVVNVVAGDLAFMFLPEKTLQQCEADKKKALSKGQVYVLESEDFRRLNGF